MLIYILLLGILCFHNYRLAAPKKTSYQGRIVEIYDNGYLLKYQDYYFNVYNINGLNFDDEIEVKGEVSEIHSLSNFNIFSYDNYAYNNNIRYSINVDDYKILRTGNTLKHKLYKYLMEFNTEYTKLATKYLYGINNASLEDNLFLSSGMYLSLFFNQLERLLGFFIEYQILNKISFVFPMMYGLVFSFNVTILRIIVNRLLRYFKLERSERLAALMIIILAINPSNCFSLAFVLPITISLSNLFYQDVIPKYLFKQLVLFPLLLNINFTYNILRAIMFSFFRYLYCIVFILILVNLGIPLFSNIIVDLYNLITDIYNSFSFVSFLDIHGSIPWYFLIAYYGILFTVYNNKHLIMLFFVVLINYTLLVYYPFNQVIMLDVGQGDCSLVKLSFNRGTIMIDTGGSKYKDIGKDVLIPYLYSLNISEIDILFVTHYDYDHSGALATLVESINIKKIIDVDNYDQQHNLQFKNFRILNNKTYPNLNDNSLVIYFELDKKAFLYPGDISKHIEKQLIRDYDLLSVDVLKLAHHGSATSSDYAFLSKLNPNLALVSAGYNNMYAHPASAVVDNLEILNIPYLNTADKGAIKLVLINNQLFFTNARR